MVQTGNIEPAQSSRKGTANAVALPRPWSADGKGISGLRPVIMLELNELCPRLLDKWMLSGDLPNFKALHNISQVYITDVDVDDPRNLEPWIQWYSMHTGLGFDRHGVFHLTDGPRAGHMDIWEMLLKAGYRVGNCGSMNAKQFSAKGAYYIPDPWCTSERAIPDSLNAFHSFIAANVQEYTNTNKRLGIGDYGRFLGFLLTHGLQPGTIIAVLKQLGTEKFIDSAEYWRRVALLDMLQFDVFKHYQQTLKPHFSTFFANSVAHLQHAHWREMEPEAYVVKASEQNQRRYGDAILFGYKAIDGLVGRFMRLARKQNAIIVFASALSQQPFLKYEGIGGQQFYRVRDIEVLLHELGVSYQTVQPTMTHQYQVMFSSEAARQDAQAKLGSLRMDGHQVFGFDSAKDQSLYFGCNVRTLQPESVMMMIGNREVRFLDIFYHIDATKSGRHHPDGCLWIQTGQHLRHDAKVSILDVMPTLLDYFGVEVPEKLRPMMKGKIIPQAFH